MSEGLLHPGGCGLSRPAPAATPRARAAPVGHGRGRGHFRRFLRLELRTGRGRIRRHASRRHRDDRHVHGPVLLHRRNVARAAPRRRRVLLRAHRHGPLGRLHHRARRKHGVHPDARRDRGGRRRIPGRHLRHRPSRGSRVVAALLWRLRRAEYLGRGDDVPRLGGRHAGRPGRPGGLLGGRRAALRPASLGTALFPTAASARSRRLCRTALRALALSGHRAAAARRRREPRPQARHAARHPLRPAHADRRFLPHRGAERGHRARRGQSRDVQRAAVPRLSDHLRPGIAKPACWRCWPAPD